MLQRLLSELDYVQMYISFLKEELHQLQSKHVLRSRTTYYGLMLLLFFILFLSYNYFGLMEMSNTLIIVICSLTLLLLGIITYGFIRYFWKINTLKKIIKNGNILQRRLEIYIKNERRS